MKKNLIDQMAFILLLVAILMPAAAFAEQPAITAQQFAQLLEQAKAARKKADSVDGEWRDVAKTITAAEQAARQGDLKTAENLPPKQSCNLKWAIGRRSRKKAMSNIRPFLTDRRNWKSLCISPDASFYRC